MLVAVSVRQALLESVWHAHCAIAVAAVVAVTRGWDAGLDSDFALERVPGVRSCCVLVQFQLKDCKSQSRNIKQCSQSCHEAATRVKALVSAVALGPAARVAHARLISVLVACMTRTFNVLIRCAV
jgi:hypothetical protein